MMSDLCEICDSGRLIEENLLLLEALNRAKPRIAFLVNLTHYKYGNVTLHPDDYLDRDLEFINEVLDKCNSNKKREG